MLGYDWIVSLPCIFTISYAFLFHFLTECHNYVLDIVGVIESLTPTFARLTRDVTSIEIINHLGCQDVLRTLMGRGVLVG